jgi:hypothetical protein
MTERMRSAYLTCRISPDGSEGLANACDGAPTLPRDGQSRLKKFLNL